jgi:tetratricopeptide (TPR) repeat protein
MPSPRLRHAACLAWLLLAAGCTTQDLIKESEAHAADGNYYLAYATLEQGRSPGNTDPALEKAYWEARLRYLIDLAQHKIFMEHEREALLDLNQALAQDPGNQTALALIERANEKMARRAVERGDAALQAGELENALLAYAEAQRSVPGYRLAVEGTKNVKLEFDRLRTKAQLHFLEALRRYPELRMYEVDWHATTAVASDPSRADARVLQVKADRFNAEKTLQRAKEEEKKGSYGAALLDYRLARTLDPSVPEIDEYIERMQSECAAQRLIEQATMMIMRAEFDKARETLGEALKKTTLEKAQVSDQLLRVRRREAENRFEAAHELQGNKQEALAGYKALLADWPEGLKDTAERIANLELDIGSAEKAYAEGVEAEAKSDFAAAAEHFQTAVTCYAKYKDAKAKLEQVKARLQK